MLGMEGLIVESNFLLFRFEQILQYRGSYDDAIINIIKKQIHVYNQNNPNGTEK